MEIFDQDHGRRFIGPGVHERSDQIEQLQLQRTRVELRRRTLRVRKTEKFQQ